MSTEWLTKTIELPPYSRGCHLITHKMLEQAKEIGMFEVGLANFFIQHTSASLTINENASPDVLLDLAGRGLQAVSRRRLVVRNGESVETRVEMDDRLCAEGLHIAEAVGLVGPAVLQAFHSQGCGTYWIEANARFGGPSILSIEAGH